MMTKPFPGSNGRVERIQEVKVRFGELDESGRPRLERIPGSELERPADLALLAMGFPGSIHEGLLEDLGVGV